MYHMRIVKRSANIAAVAAMLIGVGAMTASAQSDPNKCRVEISKQLTKYQASVNKALNKCEIGRVSGKIVAPCTPVGGDLKTADAIAKAAGKVEAALTKKCSGLTFEQTGWADCPDFHGAGCDAAFTGSFNKGVCDGGSNDGKNCTTIANCPGGICDIAISLSTPASPAEIAACVSCNADASFSAFMDLVYDAFEDSSADKDLNKCQQEIGKQLSKLVAAYGKEAGKCATARPAQGGVCPEVKSLAKIDKAATKAVEAILQKRCSAFNAAQIGLVGTCPSNAGSGLGIQGTDCSDIAVSNVASFLDCARCNAAQTPFNEFAGTCGNGITDFEVGETCDDGNTLDGDACPSDCRISECRIDPKGKTQAIAVRFTVPVGSTVSGVEAFVAYPERAVTLPGFGDVSAAITNTPPFADVTVIDTNAGLSVVALDANLDPIPAGTLFETTFTLCTSLAKGQPNLAAAWEGSKVKKAKSDDFVCVVDAAFDGNLLPVEGVTCSVEFLK